MHYFSMTLLLILICMSLRFSGAFPVLYRSLKHTGHAERYGVSILPTYFTSKFTTVFAIENDETNFYGNNYKTSCVSCQNSSVVPEKTDIDQEAGSLIHSGYTVTRQDKLNSSKLNTSTDSMDINTTPMNAISPSELSSYQNDEYIHIRPTGTEERSMTEGQSYSELYYNVEQEREKSDTYSTLQYAVSGYIGSFTVGYSSTVEHETFEEKTAAIQLEDPTKIDQTTEYQYHSVPSKNFEHILDIESVTSGYVSTPTYSNDTELHTSFQIVTQHSPRTYYTTGSTPGETERNGNRLIAPNRDIIGLKHETFSTPQLTHQGIQTTTLKSFTFEISSNEIKNKNFKTPEYEEKTSVLYHGGKNKVTYSKENGNTIGTTQQVKSNDSLMLASIISTAAQLDSNAVTVNTENYERTYSNRKQLSTAVATKEQTYYPSSLHKHVKESSTRVTDTSFETRTITTKEGNRREYKEPSTETSRKVIQTAEQNGNWRKMEMIGPSYFTLADREQLKDVEYLETIEFENELDIEMLDVNSNKNDNSEERVQVGMSNDNARMSMSQELQITGGQNNNTNLSYEYDSRTGTNLQQRFTSGSSLGQSNEDVEVQERWKKPDHSGEYYLDEGKKPEDTEFLTTAPLFHTTVQRPLNSLITNERAREENVGRLRNETQALNAQEEDIENFEIIEREEELDLAITTISPISHSRDRKGKIDNVATGQRRMESMKVANNRHDELKRNENGDLRHNSTMELRRKGKPSKHFKVEELDERFKLGKLNPKFWSKSGGNNNRRERSTKTSDSGAVTSATFAQIMKIKKQKSTVSSGQREEKNNTDSKKNYNRHSRIMPISATELVSNFTKIKKEKKQKHNIPTEEQRNMYPKKNVRNNEFHGTVSNFTKRIKVRVMKNALKDKQRDGSPLSESAGRRKIDRNRILEQKSETTFIKKRKVRKPKQILSFKGGGDADKTGSVSKLKLSKKSEDQRRQFSAAPMSNFTKKPRCKKQKHTFTYSGREEARRTEEPGNLEPHKNNHSSRWEFSRNVSRKNEKYEGLEILDNDLSILKPSKLKVGKLKEGNGNVEGNINARPFHFQRKDMKIVAKKDNVSTNEKTKEGKRKAALMLNLNQQKSRNEGMSEDRKKQSEKISSHLRNTKEPEPTMDILFRITKKNKFPRFALDMVETTVFMKRKKLSKIRQQKKTTLFIPITVPYQKSSFNTQDQYWQRKKESQEKSVNLYLPTITSYHTGFPDNKQRKKLIRYPLKLPTLFTVSKAKEYTTNVANNDSNRFLKRPKLMKFTQSYVTKPTSLWFMIKKEHKLNKERNESTDLALTELTPRLFTNKQNWNRKNERPEKTTGLFIPTTTSYQSTFLEKEQRKYVSRYPQKLSIPTLFTKSKARGYTDAVPNTYQSRFLEKPKGMLSTKFAITKPVPMWFTRRKGLKLGMEQPEETALHYPVTVADEPKFFKLSNRTDTTTLVPTIPIPVAFTKRKKPKLKVTNTTVSLSPITIFRQNKFNSSTEGNELPQTAKSHPQKVPNRKDTTALVQTIPILVAFTKRKKPKLKVTNTTLSLSPVTIFRQNKFDSFTDGNEPPQTARSHPQKVPNRTDTTALGQTIPILVAFTKRKKPKLKVTNTTVSLSPITVFRQNEFDSFPDGNEPPQTAITSHLPRMFTKLEHGVFKKRPSKTVAPFTPTTKSYVLKFHDMSRQNKKYRPALVLPLFIKRIGQGRMNEMTTPTTELVYPGTYASQPEDSRTKQPYDQESTNEMTTQVTQLFYPVTNAYQGKQQVSQTKRKQTVGDVTMPVFNFYTKWKEKDLRRKWPLKTSTRATYSHETTFGKTPKQNRRTKLPVTKAHWMFGQFPGKIPKSTVNPTTDKQIINTTASERQDSERPQEGTCLATSYGDQESTCPSRRSTPTQTTYSTSDGITDYIYEEISSSIPTFDTSSTTEWYTLDSYSESLSTEETTTDTGESDEQLTSLSDVKGLGTSPITWKATIAIKPMGPQNQLPLEHSSLISILSSHVTRDDNPIAEDTTIETNPPSAAVSSANEETDVYSTTSKMKVFSVSSTQYSTNLPDSTALNKDFHTNWSSPTDTYTDYESSVSNFPQSATEPSSLSTSATEITQESTTLNEDFHTDSASSTDSYSDNESTISNFTQSATEPSSVSTSDTEITQESTVLNEDFYTDSSSTTDTYADYESSVSNFPQSATEPSSVSTSDTDITQESTALNKYYHIVSSRTTDSYTDYESSVSYLPQSATEPSSVSISDTEITQQSTTLNEDFHTDSTISTDSYTDYESTVSNFPQSATEPSSVSTSDTEITQESTALNEDFYTDSSSTTDRYADYKSSISNFPQSATEPSSLSTSDSETTQEATALNEDFHTDSSSTTDRDTGYESSVSNFPQSATELSSLSSSDTEITQESTALNEDFHTDSSRTADSYTDYESSDSKFPQSATEPSSLSSSDTEVTQELTALNEDFHTDSSSTTTFNTDTELSISNGSPFTSEPVYTRTEGPVFVTSINTSPISDSNAISISSLTSPFSTPITSGITSHAQHEENTEDEEDILQQSVADGSNTTVSYFGTEVANTNVSKSVSNNLHVGIDDLVLSSSKNTSAISNLLPSPGETISSSPSPLTTPLTHEITSSTSFGAHLVSFDGVQQASDSSKPGLPLLRGGSKSSTSFISHFVDENVAGISTTMGLGSISRRAPTHSSSSTAATEITKRRTCRRLVKTSPMDSVSCALPTPFLTLRPTSRRRLKSSTRSTA